MYHSEIYNPVDGLIKKAEEIWEQAYSGPKQGSNPQGGSASGPPQTPTRPGTQQSVNTGGWVGNSNYNIDISKFHPWENPYTASDPGKKNQKKYNERVQSVNNWLNDPKNAGKVNLRPTPVAPTSFNFAPRLSQANMSYMDLYNKSKDYLRSTPLWQRGDNSEFLRRFGFVPGSNGTIKTASANITGLVKAADALDFTDPNARAFMRGQIDDYKAGIGPSIYSHANQATQWQNVDRQYRPTGWSLYGDLPLYRNYSYLTNQFGNLSTATQASQYQRQQRKVQDAQFKKDHSDIYNSPEYKQMTSSPEYKQKLQASQQKIDQQYAPMEKYLQHWQNVADSMKRSQEIMDRQDKQIAEENTTIQNMAGQMDPSKFNKANPLDTVHYMDQQIAEKRRQAGAANIDPQEKARLDAEVKSLQSAAVRARSQAQDAARKDPSLMSDFASRHGRHNVGSTVMDDSITNPYYKQRLQEQQKAFRAEEQVQNTGSSPQPTTPQPATKPATPTTQPAAKPNATAPQPAATQKQKPAV